MFVDFDKLPDQSRIWIYQANSRITPELKQVIKQMLETFAEKWMVHGAPVKASFTICNDYFVVLAADESFNAVSGCSIDSSVHVIKQIGSNTGIDFFSRTSIPFLVSDSVVLLDMKELRQKLEEGIWQGETFTFNTGITTIGEFRRGWIVPAKDTWLKRFLPANQMSANA